MRANPKQSTNILNESNRAQNNKQRQRHRIECNNNQQFKIQRDNLIKKQINTIVQVPIQHLMDFIQIYEWRQQTDYPIVSSKWKQVIFNHKSMPIIHKQQLIQQLQLQHINNQYPFVQLEVETVYPLSIYLPLSFTHFLYALKETLVGFQRLLAMFGTFQIVENMITVNREGKVKVWISEHWQQNSKVDIDQSKLYVNEEHYMISKIKDIFLKFASQNSIFRDFFKHLQNINTFLHFFKYVQEFMLFKKVIIGKPILKKSHITNKRPLSPIINLKPIGRTPKFITSSKKQIPCLGLAFRQTLHKPRQFNFSQLKTKETFLNEETEKYNFQQETNSSPNKAGKIIKNNLSKIKSLNDLSHNRSDFEIQKSNIRMCINRLFQEDEPIVHQTSSVKQTNLMDLGRQVRQSIIMRQM